MSGTVSTWARRVLHRAIASSGKGKVVLRREEAQVIARALGGSQGHGCLVQEDGDPCFCGGAETCPNRLDPRPSHPAFMPR